MAKKITNNSQPALPEMQTDEVNLHKKEVASLNVDSLRVGKNPRFSVPNFSDINRPLTCLEVDFPIASVNELSNLEGNAGKPVYQMSKWWARRRSSVFRCMLIAAATEAPEDTTQASKLVWEHYYSNYQKPGYFKKLRVLDCFMGGGTTMVEGARLGFQMTGVDLNPVAWFVVKNELACSDPQQVQTFFDHLEQEVKPLVKPFYITTCPRGHKGQWIAKESGTQSNIDPFDLLPEQRKQYYWQGPEVIYTFWAKHGPCKADGCGHRTPIFKDPIIAEKKLTTQYIPLTCPSCGHDFQAELGETRMAPGTEHVILSNEPSFTELSQAFAQRLKDYSKGRPAEKEERAVDLLGMINTEQGLICPSCGMFAGETIKRILERHTSNARRVADIKKKDFSIGTKSIYMYLLIHPDWLSGPSGIDEEWNLGGYAGASARETSDWYKERLKNCKIVEVRGRIKLSEEDAAFSTNEASELILEDVIEQNETAAERKKYGLPSVIILRDGTSINTRRGTVPRKSAFTCGVCGRTQDILDSVKRTGQTAPVAPYTLQCYCPQCDAEGYNYGGRYFKAPDIFDVELLEKCEQEWVERSQNDLHNWWPREKLFESYMTHRLNGGIPNWGYTHWWKMFNPRQLLVHAQLLQAITINNDQPWSLDIREQALGAFQQYLRNQNMFCFWDKGYDKLVPSLSNANFHPKSLVVENCVFQELGRGNWKSSSDKVTEGVAWLQNPWELYLNDASGTTKSRKVEPQDPVIAGQTIYCQSSTDLSMLDDKSFDLVITDPPFGNNLFYADLADFFYVWLRIPMLRWYQGYSEFTYFESSRTPHALEAIQNPVEHADHREEWEKKEIISQEYISVIREQIGDSAIKIGSRNPLYRSEPAADFYQNTLSACWAEAGRLLKPGGLMAFTFHHNEDAAWIHVLEALFDAGYILVATYPIRSDETKGNDANPAFGSKKFEYDIIHVCRKRPVSEVEPISWVKMRRWVREEVAQKKNMLELYRQAKLPKSDIRMILLGKALEFYSRHYGKVYTGVDDLLTIRDAILGINQLLNDLLEDTETHRPPEIAEPTTQLFLRTFLDRASMPRDELHKLLRGTGISQDDLEERGWIVSSGAIVRLLSIEERFQFFIAPGRTRKILKTDLDQAQFLIGSALKSGINIIDELNRDTFSIKKSTDALLMWFAKGHMAQASNFPLQEFQEKAQLAYNLVSEWRTSKANNAKPSDISLWEVLEAEE